jgi:hypothetical protein
MEIIIAKKPTNKCNNVIDVLTISKHDTYNKIVGNVKLNKSENYYYYFKTKKVHLKFQTI